MEVLKSDDKLKQEILKDAKIKAEKTINKAKEDVSEIEKKTSNELIKIQEEVKKNFDNEISFETKKIFASIDILIKKKTIDYIGEFINEIFDDLKKSIINNKIYKYKDFLIKLIQKAGEKINSESYILEMSEIYSNDLSIEELKNIKFKKGSIKEVLIIRELEGLKLYSKDKKKVIFLSLDTFFEKLKQDERNKIYEIITKEA